MATNRTGEIEERWEDPAGGPQQSRDGRLLLHTCCAPCAAGCIERLRGEGYEAVLYFSNSNIHPRDEYDRRLGETGRFAKIYGLELVVDDYDHERWRDAVRGYEAEREKGKRCDICFRYNLGRTARAARAAGISRFSTTLTLSPHKKSVRVFGAGERFPGFVPIDFKKRDGQKKSSEISGKYGLYRQNYCGCEFSIHAGEK